MQPCFVTHTFTVYSVKCSSPVMLIDVEYVRVSFSTKTRGFRDDVTMVTSVADVSGFTVVPFISSPSVSLCFALSSLTYTHTQSMSSYIWLSKHTITIQYNNVIYRALFTKRPGALTHLAVK